jgi:hypothetical protein
MVEEVRMRYMFLVYSKEVPDVPVEAYRDVAGRHGKVMEEARKRGVFLAADPLKPTGTATTVRMEGGKALITDGPFAETKEQLAGYYILDCRDLDEAIEWGKKIPSGCKGGEGCIEIRPIQEMSAVSFEA